MGFFFSGLWPLNQWLIILWAILAVLLCCLRCFMKIRKRGGLDERCAGAAVFGTRLRCKLKLLIVCGLKKVHGAVCLLQVVIGWSEWQNDRKALEKSLCGLPGKIPCSCVDQLCSAVTSAEGVLSSSFPGPSLLGTAPNCPHSPDSLTGNLWQHQNLPLMRSILFVFYKNYTFPLPFESSVCYLGINFVYNVLKTWFHSKSILNVFSLSSILEWFRLKSTSWQTSSCSLPPVRGLGGNKHGCS